MDFKYEAAKLIAKAADMEIDEVLGMIEVPANKEMGDYAFPCFKLAKKFRKAPNLIAADICGKLEGSDSFTKIECVAAYINFFTDKSSYAKTVIESVNNAGAKYGESSEGEGKTIVIDYSSPNIAKPFHVGHLRSTVIGSALYNIFEKLGYKCVGINHLGDWGTQFGKLIEAYKLWGSKEAVEEKGISELTRIYVKFHEEAEKDDSLNDRARAWFVKMQDGDEEAISLWKWFYDISIKEFERVYEKLGVKFDYYTGESFYNDKMDAVVEELKAKNLLVESNGAMIVDLEDAKMPPCLILRTDGGTLYATRDITAALYRKKTYDFDKCIYVTAIDQNLHFAQWFKVIEKMGYDWSKDLVHVPFGLVSLEDGKLSTRKGKVVLMEDLLNEAVKKTTGIIDEKNPDLPNKEEVAKQVGIGAVIFDDLYNGRIKDIVFSWDRMLNFDGETGPYVQYTHARACSVLKKAGYDKKAENIDYSVLADDAAADVCKTIALFNDKIKEAANRYEPSVIARYLVDVAQSFNKFYHDNIILADDENVKNARLALVDAVRTVIKSGLAILGIDAPEQM
ncbi:arginine--tRNA ligase [Anaerotignum sp. MSJ-24]|uniref:arginine--tRNA ligase n=1 Tax=Anaerotignum sp. MSJ-24 TaxID=2841521 RepID=UPI001C0FD100|nr:arginine--tRNA ligase [Anaerotignum sp. MSJ-24]MBU5463932.1 arginine--tRNA ligase [Anaerotignum sp. MSJ-24]